MAIFGITREYWIIVFPMLGFMAGAYLDRKETERLSMFRDKSALYGRKLAPGEAPSW